MGGQNGWRQIVTGEDWMRNMEKRVLHEERRPQIRTAADLLGPGVAPWSVLITDWNQAETVFNGFFHSEPGAANTPRDGGYWMGTSQATTEGFGVQRVTEYRGNQTEVDWPAHTWVRRFYTSIDGSVRGYSTWEIEDDTQPGIMAEFAMTGAPNGWLICDGALHKIVDYPDLYKVIGKHFNLGLDPSDSFRVPNASGKVIKT